MQPHIQYLPLVVAAAVTAVAAIHDYRTGVIPNRVIVWGAGFGTLSVVAVAVPSGFAGLGAAILSLLLGMSLASLVPLFMYRFEAIGGGDVKLLAVAGALLGPMRGLEMEFYAFTAVLVYAPFKLLKHGVLVQTLRNTANIIMRPFARNRPNSTVAEQPTSFRFGPAIFVGTAVVAGLRLAGVA